MLTYEYECQECKYNFETRQSIKDKPLVECPQCKSQTLERIIGSDIIFIDKTPRTLGTLAEKNTRKMGSYEKDKKQKETEDRSNLARKRAVEEGMKLKGLTPIDTSKIKKPWYSKNAPPTSKLQKLNNKQKKDYIEKGTLPPNV